MNKRSSSGSNSDGHIADHDKALLDESHGTLLQALIETNLDAVVVCTTTGEIIAVNTAFVNLFDYSMRWVVGKNISILCAGDVPFQDLCGINRYTATGVKRCANSTIEPLLGRKKSGAVFPMSLKFSEWKNPVGKRMYFATIHAHIIESKLDSYEQLLKQMLPQDVIDVLLSHSNGQHENSHHASNFTCSVGCINLLKFTRNASNVSAVKLSSLVSRIYTEFDRICQKTFNEPLKTSGGFYMFTSRRSAFAHEHAANTVLCALQCIDAIKRWQGEELSPKFDVKVGIATGLVAFGIIKSKRLVYDAWGLTVNLASQLSAIAPVNGVLVSEQTYIDARGMASLHFEGPIRELGKADNGESGLKAYSVWNSEDNLFVTENNYRAALLNDISSTSTNDSVDQLCEYLAQRNVDTTRFSYDEEFDLQNFSYVMIIVNPQSRSGIDACRRLTLKNNCPPCALFIPSQFYSKYLCLHFCGLGLGQSGCFEIPHTAAELEPWLDDNGHFVKNGDQKRKKDIRRHSVLDDQIEFTQQQPFTILIVDDVNVNILLAKKLFIPFTRSIRLISATNGPAAIKLVETEKIDLCIVDVRMPHMDGIEVTEILRKSFDDEQLPIIGLTSADELDVLTRCYDAGMNDVLYKPLDAARVKALVSRWFPYAHSTSTN